jgi:hypothetical protein
MVLWHTTFSHMYIIQIPTLFIISSLQALTILTRLGIRHVFRKPQLLHTGETLFLQH